MSWPGLLAMTVFLGLFIYLPYVGMWDAGSFMKTSALEPIALYLALLSFFGELFLFCSFMLFDV